MKKVAVLLSGCGVYDGSEIHEAVFSLLAIAEQGASYQCFAPDIPQHHVINHITGEEMPESRNALVEAARIARGEIKSLKEYRAAEFDAMVIPGGFGAAKNLTKWAFSGPEGAIEPEVQRCIAETVQNKKPIAALCMGPTVIARALKQSGLKVELSVGSTEEKSPYDIAAISKGIEASGAKAVMKSVREIQIDEKHRIISAPCYMMEASIAEVKKNIDQAIRTLLQFD